jgi:hypothetical protein
MGSIGVIRCNSTHNLGSSTSRTFKKLGPFSAKGNCKEKKEACPIHQQLPDKVQSELSSEVAESCPHTTYFFKSILILFSHLRLCIPCGLFPSGFPNKIFCAFIIAPVHATCPTRFIFFDLITLIICGEEYTISSLRNKIIDAILLLGLWLILQTFVSAGTFCKSSLFL